MKESPILREDRTFDRIFNGELIEYERNDTVGQCRQSIETHSHHLKINAAVFFPLNNGLWSDQGPESSPEWITERLD